MIKEASEALFLKGAKQLRNVTALVAFGGNLGNVKVAFNMARKAMGQHSSCQVLRSSRYYKTPPLGSAGQSDYLNAMVEIGTTLGAEALLEFLQCLEDRAGRIRAERWGARTLDLDLIDYANCCHDDPYLTLPHARTHERLFVLGPLCDICPTWQHPRNGKLAIEMRDMLLAQGEVPLPEGKLW
ncbi:MAG: 2-amino-4-hydroxy-6-hydroxymethyldihydropteridine diphosphokinase [Mariprofundaceae bacterium]